MHAVALSRHIRQPPTPIPHPALRLTTDLRRLDVAQIDALTGYVRWARELKMASPWQTSFNQ
jgi:hypothetical protein